MEYVLGSVVSSQAPALAASELAAGNAKSKGHARLAASTPQLTSTTAISVIGALLGPTPLQHT